MEGIAMRSVLHAVKRFVRSEDGPTAVEYAVMLALIIVVCIIAITTLGQAAKDKFNQVGTTINNAQPQ
jgi:pilus assembly protein Flp/PilA